MIKTTLLSVTAILGLVAAAQASIVTLSAGRTGPLVITSGGSPVSGGLVRVGTLSGAPAGNSIDDINAVFREFGTSVTSATGGLGASVSNPAGTPFDNQKIYVWVFSGADAASSAEHGVFSVVNAANPGSGNPWTFPMHTGTGTDANTITLGALLTNGDSSVTPGIMFDSQTAGGRLVLTPVPEPSGALLAGLAGALIAFRRRR